MNHSNTYEKISNKEAEKIAFGKNPKLNERQELPWWQKYTLTLEEAAEYFGVSYKKLRIFCKEHADEDFILWNGNRALIKKQMFERYVDTKMSVI